VVWYCRATASQYHFFIGAFLGWILIVLNLQTAIPNLVMYIYKFGRLTNASLVLNEVGCNIVQQYGLQEKPTSPDQKTCTLPNVVIHSRLGTTYYVQVSRNGNTPVCFTIPTESVLSWSVNAPKKPTVVEAPQSTQNSAAMTERCPR
jgi:hypothetical protein